MGALGIAAVSPQRAMASEDYERKARPEGERPREKDSFPYWICSNYRFIPTNMNAFYLLATPFKAACKYISALKPLALVL